MTAATGADQGLGRRLRRRALSGTAWNGLNRFVTVAVSFVLTPLIVSTVGATDYGLYVVAGAIVGYGSLLDLGVGGALTKHVAEHAARDEWERLASIVAASVRLAIALGAIVTLLGLVAAVALPLVLAFPPGQASTARALIALMGLGLGVAIGGTTVSAALRGLQRYALIGAIRIGGALLGAVATVAVLAAGWGVVGLAVTSVPITVAMQAAALLALGRAEPRLRFGIRGASREDLGRVVRFGRPLVVLDVAGRLQSESDEIVIAAALPVASVTPFSLAAKVAALPRAVAEPFAQVLLPLASELGARDDAARLRTTFLTGTRVTAAVVTPFAVTLSSLAQPFLRRWVGDAFVSSAPLVAILVVAAGIDLLLWPAGFVLQGIARHARVAWISLASGVANVVLSFALAIAIGLPGVALATLVATTGEALVLLPYAMRILGIGTARLVREALAPALLPAIPAGLVLVATETFWKPADYPELALAGGVAVAFYAAVYLLAAATRQERILARDTFAAVRSTLAGVASRGRLPG